MSNEEISKSIVGATETICRVVDAYLAYNDELEEKEIATINAAFAVLEAAAEKLRG